MEEDLEPSRGDVELEDRPEDEPWIGPERWLQPEPRERAIEDYDEKYVPILRREPLARAANNYAPVRVRA